MVVAVFVVVVVVVLVVVVFVFVCWCCGKDVSLCFYLVFFFSFCFVCCNEILTSIRLQQMIAKRFLCAPACIVELFFSALFCFDFVFDVVVLCVHVFICLFDYNKDKGAPK